MGVGWGGLVGFGMWKLIAPLVLLVGVVLVAVSAGGGIERSDVTVVNGTDVNTLDPHKMSWMQDLRTARMIYEGLVTTDVFTPDQAIAPGVAASWSVSDDGLVYTFNLRDDARWSNGDRVTAHDFVYSWRRALLPDIGADYANFFWLIEGGREFYDWRAERLGELEREPRAGAGIELWRETLRRFDETVGVRAVDELTLEVRLRKPVSYFLDLCAFAVLYPVYEPLVSRYDTLDPATGRVDPRGGWTDGGVLVSNGAFRLQTWRQQRGIRLVKNEYYWNADDVSVRSVSIPSIPEPNAQVLAFESGTADVITDVTVEYRAEMIRQKFEFYEEHAEEVARLRGLGLDPIAIDRALPPDDRNRIHVFPAFATYWYNFNTQARLPDGRENPFADARVRRAFAMTIDKRAIVENIRQAGEPVARTLIPPGSLGEGYRSPEGIDSVGDARSDEGREAIAARARALLAEAGYPDPSEFITVEILFNKDSGHDLIAQSVANDWRRYLGVPVRLSQKSLNVFRDDLKKHNFMVSRAGWYGDFSDPVTFLDLSRTGDNNNDRAYSNPEYDAILDAAAVETDPASRFALLSQAEAMLMNEEVPMVPVFHYVDVRLFDPHRISGITSHPRQTQNLELLDILGDGYGRETPLALPAGGSD